MNIRAALGKKGEQLVAQHLQQRGFDVIAQNYRQPFGEIDLIAAKHDLLVFVEVKLRQTNYFDATLLITYSKQKKIILTAKKYVLTHKLFDKTCRFDVALIHADKTKTEITYLEDAFREYA